MIFSGGIDRMRENNNGRSYGNNLFVPFSPIRRIVDEIMNGNQNNQYYFERLFFILRQTFMTPLTRLSRWDKDQGKEDKVCKISLLRLTFIYKKSSMKTDEFFHFCLRIRQLLFREKQKKKSNSQQKGKNLYKNKKMRLEIPFYFTL